MCRRRIQLCQLLIDLLRDSLTIEYFVVALAPDNRFEMAAQVDLLCWPICAVRLFQILYSLQATGCGFVSDHHVYLKGATISRIHPLYKVRSLDIFGYHYAHRRIGIDQIQPSASHK